MADHRKRIPELINTLNLEPHPEGGFFSEVYRSDGTIQTENGEFPDGRCFSTSIYYLLRSEDISKFHRIKSDEIWHHYEGSSITIHLIFQGGLYETRSLGKNLKNGQRPQHVVPAGGWFGVTVDYPDSFALCGCTVAPGFEFRDFEMAERDVMLEKFPNHESIINKLLP
jgi:uncharacterized protein